MDRKDVLNAANILKDYCNDHDCCKDCIFKKGGGCCTLAYTACRWKIPKSDSEPDNCSSERIAELHREIELRDRKIYEIEQQLAIKDSILKKQGVMIAELREEQSGC